MNKVFSIYCGKQHPFYEEMDELCFAAKNLYNRALFLSLKIMKETKKYENNYTIDRILREEKDSCYYHFKFRAQVSQQILVDVHKAFVSWFALRKTNSKTKPPKYKKKFTGRHSVKINNQILIKTKLDKGLIQIPKTNIVFLIPKQLKNKKILQILIVPRVNGYSFDIIYKDDDTLAKEDNGRYAAIDLGINNFATVSSNVCKPFIINGKPLKSINQHFNKRTAELRSLHKRPSKPKATLREDDSAENYENWRIYEKSASTNLMRSISQKRQHWISDFLHKASRRIIDFCVSNDLHTLILGYNKGWKQSVNMGKKNNQKFVSIPFEKFKQKLEYKCKDAGINLVITEESYTSKCSFLDREELCKHDVYQGKRVKRGLFRSSKGWLINADLNGSLNIMRKGLQVIGKTLADYPILACGTPSVFTVK